MHRLSQFAHIPIFLPSGRLGSQMRMLQFIKTIVEPTLFDLLFVEGLLLPAVGSQPQLQDVTLVCLKMEVDAISRCFA